MLYSSSSKFYLEFGSIQVWRLYNNTKEGYGSKDNFWILGSVGYQWGHKTAKAIWGRLIWAQAHTYQHGVSQSIMWEAPWGHKHTPTSFHWCVWHFHCQGSEVWCHLSLPFSHYHCLEGWWRWFYTNHEVTTSWDSCANIFLKKFF